MNDNETWYFTANFITYILIYALGIMGMIQIIENIIIRVIILFVLFLVCGYIEEKILSRFVNGLVEKLLRER